MKALQATCIVGAMAFTVMIHQLGGNTPGASVPDAMPEAAVSAETSGAPALSAAVPEAPAGPATALATAPGAEPGPAPAAVSGPSLMAAAETGGDSIETKSVDSKAVDLGHHDAAQPVPTTRDASGDASNDASKPAPVTQDFRYLIYYVWSELP